MRKQVTKRRRHVSNAERQRNKLVITGGLALVLLVVIIAIGVFVFGSCGVDYADTDTNTVYVLKNGKVISTDVEAFNEKTYSAEELESYLQTVINTYNAGSDKELVKQKSLTIEENVATLVIEYANTEVYEEVNGVELFNGTIEEATKAGYDFAVDFAKFKDGKALTATMEEFEGNEDYKVIIIKSNTKVVIPGEVCFVSTKNIAKVGEGYVLIKDGSELLTEEVFVNTEFGTEAEGSDGSISEDELVVGEESDDIIFDFGDVEENKSQYSEVLTYIIYK